MFSWLGKISNGIWAWCLDAIVDELGSFTLIGFSDGSLVWNIFVRESIFCPENTNLDIGSFTSGCEGYRVLLVWSV